VAGLLLLSLASAVLVVRSQWFYEKVRELIVGTVETATGGRVEAASFRFDWKRLRAEITGFAIHGNEPGDKPALFRASSVAVGLKIVSLFKRDVDIQYLEVADPRVYLMVYPDGRTNVPEPKTKGSEKPPVETLLNLAIGRFDMRNGLFEIESRGETPFDARGRNLNLRLLYERTGPRYLGEVSIQPLDVQWPGLSPAPLAVNLALSIEKNRIGVTSARLATGDSRIEFSGAVEDLAAPRGKFQYEARVSVADASRILHLEELERGTVEVAGNATWRGPSDFSAAGKLHAYNVDYRDSTLRLRNYRVEGSPSAGPWGIDLSGVRLGGAGPCPAQAAQCPVTAEGQIAGIALRGRDLDFRGVALTIAGGSFRGEAHVRDLDRYTVNGDLADFGIKRTVAMYSPAPLPWDGSGSGTMRLEGSLRRKSELRVAADLTIAPAPRGLPVRGHIMATYEARSGLLDLGRSTLTLPSSRAEFSGGMQAGRELRVHAETRDLNDILPALGENAADFPVRLESGAAIFDGTVTGTLDSPHIAGHVNVTRFSYEGRIFDSLQADANASPASLEARNAAITQGTLRAQFQGSIGLSQWKIEDSSAIAASGTMRNADVAALAALLDAKDAPVTGSLSGSAQVSGTIADPQAKGDLDVVKGIFFEEPFDRITARVSYSGRTVQVTSGQILAGTAEVQLAATFDHAPGRFDQGRLRFQVSSNAVPLEQVRMVQKLRPDVKGSVQVEANGDVDLIPSQGGKPGLRITGLHADVSARGLRLTGQALGDAHLTADSQNAVLHAHLESAVADSAIRGDGQWQLAGNYPGSATITFSRVDFARLRQWIAPEQPSTPQPPGQPSPADRLSGFAEGELRIEGPALQTEALKAELRITKFELAGSAPRAGGGVASPASSFSLQNSGPIVASMVNNVVTVDSARFAGRGTDLSVTGKVPLQQKNPLDLRVNGRLDLAVVHEFNPDLASSGAVTAEATVRGPLDSPQINGRLQFQNAAFSLNDLPNGISNANGAILLTNDVHGASRENRATIQSFTGETGGGKIELSGFAAYSGDEALFRVHARAEQVRVRYPEGVSTVANARLDLTGTPARSELSGTITILRTGFNLQSDFSSLIAKSAEPVRTPAARSGLLGGLNFDVQIETAPDTQFQSSLTEDLQAEANLRLRGTFSNPAVVGRVTITQGQVVFYGTRYTISDGSIAFYNPLKVEPILDINLETKANGIDITLTVAGPLNKLHLTPRSDPPLQFNEIVALLATGRSPTSDPTVLTQESTAPQSWQQMGATALLGQAIANPVAGRLQRFFGVSKLRIDPTIGGVENNPQARLTLEQQVTSDLTFTYITDVTSTNPQVVRVEWSFSKQWSAVALREENGVFGLDFFFKKRF